MSVEGSGFSGATGGGYSNLEKWMNDSMAAGIGAQGIADKLVQSGYEPAMAVDIANKHFGKLRTMQQRASALSSSMSSDFDKTLPDRLRGAKHEDIVTSVFLFEPKTKIASSDEKRRGAGTVLFVPGGIFAAGTIKFESAGKGTLHIIGGDVFLFDSNNNMFPMGRLIDQTISVERNFKMSIKNPDGHKLYLRPDTKGLTNTGLVATLNAVGGSIIAERAIVACCVGSWGPPIGEPLA